MPVQVLVAKRLARVRKRGREASDQRVGLVHEFLVGVRIIKLLAWEMSFLKKVGNDNCSDINLLPICPVSP